MRASSLENRVAGRSGIPYISGMPEVSPTLDMPRLDTGTSFRKEAYAALKRAICAMDIYDHPHEIRLDERRLSEGLGVSRTPIREAMTLLEQEGFVRTRPRRGIFVVRKTKREIVEMITVWAALEGMAARLVCTVAADSEIAQLRRQHESFHANPAIRAHIGEYSDANIHFHQTIVRLSRSSLIEQIIDGLFLHVRAIRQRTIFEADRVERSLVDHMAIIEALEARQAERAERLVVDHTLRLRDHVERHVDLD